MWHIDMGPYIDRCTEWKHEAYIPLYSQKMIMCIVCGGNVICTKQRLYRLEWMLRKITVKTKPTNEGKRKKKWKWTQKWREKKQKRRHSPSKAQAGERKTPPKKKKKKKKNGFRKFCHAGSLFVYRLHLLAFFFCFWSFLLFYSCVFVIHSDSIKIDVLVGFGLELMQHGAIIELIFCHKIVQLKQHHTLQWICGFFPFVFF